MLLEQCLPFTVLKLFPPLSSKILIKSWNSAYRLRYWNLLEVGLPTWIVDSVGTVLTVYGIETLLLVNKKNLYPFSLEQCLPFTVLKLPGVKAIAVNPCARWNSAYRLRYWNCCVDILPFVSWKKLEQCLPFTVLKRNINLISLIWHILPITIALTI